MRKQLDELILLRLQKRITNKEFDKTKELLVVEQKSVRGNLQKIDKRADEWLELCEKTYNFATYAFKKGQVNRKGQSLKLLVLT